LKVVVSARLTGRIREILDGHDVIAPRVDGDAVLDDATLRAELRDADALLPLLSVRVDEALLAGAPRLRIVANNAVGYDNVDLAAATRRGVVVTNTPGVLTAATADLTMALVLAAARRIGEGMGVLARGAWLGWEPEQLVGLDLDGATLGIVGLGRIGRAVAQRARAFGMRVIHTGRADAGPDGDRDRDRDRVPLDELLGASDVVSIHCPLSPATRHLIGARELALMKPDAILVNTARGAIVDEAALVDALDRGLLGGVGLDVFEHEPRVPPALLAHARVVAVPHIGSAARRTRARMAETAAQSIADLFAGRRPAHVVNPEALVVTDSR
jgi:glyoxylate reductase